ncbi:MAG: aminopeptidase [Flavobacteriales bacterium]|jgi:putative aminopeptidase FrvX|tara:strand:- start:98 stop:1021 length:924 start_codon:yes stop_codon:yes gene_type:complete
MKLLKELCGVHAPSGNEIAMTEYLLDYIEKNKKNWKVQPEIIFGDGFQDCIMLKFGNPTTAIFAHIDSIGFTVKYNKEIVKIGGPRTIEGTKLVGEDSQGKFECELLVIEYEDGPDRYEYILDREIDRGTDLVFKREFIETDSHVQSCYMDNRLGVWNALQVAENLENGVICFSCWEEHGGGSVGYLARHMYENWGVRQALISDITWITEGVTDGDGVAISMRDSGLPRRSYINRIIALAKQGGIKYQLEVENAGGSDGNALQKSPYPFDWCFIGAAEHDVHSPTERVNKADVIEMVKLYEYLMEKL